MTTTNSVLGDRAATTLRALSDDYDRLARLERGRPDTETLLARGRELREELLDRHASTIYHDITDGLTTSLRLAELLRVAADRFPGLVPSAAALAREHARSRRDKLGVEVDQGILVAHLLADPVTGEHLMEAMTLPHPRSTAALAELRRTGSADLGPVRVDRAGRVGHVTLQNLEALNSEDAATTEALEIAVDVVLLDDEIDIGVLRGARMVHPRWAGRRVFGSGINLTRLHDGRIPLVEFFLERELGVVSKIQRGHPLGGRGSTGTRREKPWIAAVDSFAIGGACQFLLVVDHVIAEADAYFSLPATREGIVPGCGGGRLARAIGEQRAKRVVFFGDRIPVSTSDGQRLAGDIVPAEDMAERIDAAAAHLTLAGMQSVRANRRALRLATEPLATFRQVMSAYARDQAYCADDPALVANLERVWPTARRSA
ncbi:enoyl-CoA hydratase/isomerase family protein [Amycolatopsis sp. lyj-346]|uniref:enoyl-CoA hydratase/isomerase family protein n=1 Tax=Amycolatopsis sp. lyj-346 TaxID=2789289 RepID=UPI00397DCC5A